MVEEIENQRERARERKYLAFRTMTRKLESMDLNPEDLTPEFRF